MSQLKEWMYGGKISKLVVVITSKETGEHVERWQFDVSMPAILRVLFLMPYRSRYSARTQSPKRRKRPRTTRIPPQSGSCPSASHVFDANQQRSGNDAPEEKTETEIQAEIQSIFRQITASVTFLPMLDGNCTFNVLVYADADSDVPLEWGDSDAKEIQNGEKVQLRSFSTSNHRVDTLVSYRYASIEDISIIVIALTVDVGLVISRLAYVAPYFHFLPDSVPRAVSLSLLRRHLPFVAAGLVGAICSIQYIHTLFSATQAHRL